MSSGIAYWPGDLNPAQFQTLSYSPSTNTLSLSPFGNSVVITPTTQTVSTINASTINTSNIFVDITNSSTINSYTENVTNASISTLTVSSINGIVFTPPTQVQSWIDPSAPASVSTLASALTIIPAASFSTIAGHTYMVTMEYGASNLGGGAATDQTSINIVPLGTGHVTIADSFITDQTYVTRQATPTAVVYCASSNATVGVANDSAGGNVQAISFFRLFTQDLGVQNNNY